MDFKSLQESENPPRPVSGGDDDIIGRTMSAAVSEERMSASAECRRSLLNFYWEIEIQGLRLAFAMLKQFEDEDSLINLTRLVADEARHVWLLSKKIVDLGGTPMPDSRAHRTRRAQMVRIPKDAAELMALAVAAKERAYNRYTMEFSTKIRWSPNCADRSARTKNPIWLGLGRNLRASAANSIVLAASRAT